MNNNNNGNNNNNNSNFVPTINIGAGFANNGGYAINQAGFMVCKAIDYQTYVNNIEMRFDNNNNCFVDGLGQCYDNNGNYIGFINNSKYGDDYMRKYNDNINKNKANNNNNNNNNGGSNHGQQQMNILNGNNNSTNMMDNMSTKSTVTPNLVENIPDAYKGPKIDRTFGLSKSGGYLLNRLGFRIATLAKANECLNDNTTSFDPVSEVFIDVVGQCFGSDGMYKGFINAVNTYVDADMVAYNVLYKEYREEKGIDGDIPHPPANIENSNMIGNSNMALPTNLGIVSNPTTPAPQAQSQAVSNDNPYAAMFIKSSGTTVDNTASSNTAITMLHGETTINSKETMETNITNAPNAFMVDVAESNKSKEIIELEKQIAQVKADKKALEEQAMMSTICRDEPTRSVVDGENSIPPKEVRIVKAQTEVIEKTEKELKLEEDMEKYGFDSTNPKTLANYGTLCSGYKAGEKVEVTLGKINESCFGGNSEFKEMINHNSSVGVSQQLNFILMNIVYRNIDKDTVVKVSDYKTVMKVLSEEVRANVMADIDKFIKVKVVSLIEFNYEFIFNLAITNNDNIVDAINSKEIGTNVELPKDAYAPRNAKVPTILFLNNGMMGIFKSGDEYCAKRYLS